jgi:hypothetical protein
MSAPDVKFGAALLPSRETRGLSVSHAGAASLRQRRCLAISVPS